MATDAHKSSAWNSGLLCFRGSNIGFAASICLNRAGARNQAIHRPVVMSKMSSSINWTTFNGHRARKVYPKSAACRETTQISGE